MYLPKFKTTEDRDLYFALFKEKYGEFKICMDIVKDSLFGEKITYNALTGCGLEQIIDITRSLSYDVETAFKREKEEYKTEDDDDIFVPRHSLKDSIKTALEEISTEDWAHLESGIFKGLGDK